MANFLPSLPAFIKLKNVKFQFQNDRIRCTIFQKEIKLKIRQDEMSSFEELRTNIDLILECIRELKIQKEELSVLIENQLVEKACLEAEIERITYKLGNLSKNLCQRISTKEEYDKTIREAEEMYKHLTTSSTVLLQNVTKNSTQLQESMDKKVGTDSIINVFEGNTPFVNKEDNDVLHVFSLLNDNFDLAESLKTEAQNYVPEKGKHEYNFLEGDKKM